MERQYIIALIGAVVVGAFLISLATGSYHLTDISGPMIISGPRPLTPQISVAFNKAAVLDKAAKSAQACGDYTKAAIYYRAETRLPLFAVLPWAWISLGEVLDAQGKEKEAFAAYQKGFGSHMAGCGHPEDAARFGLMCEDAGFHAQACECYYGLRTSEDIPWFSEFTLDSQTTPPAQTRAMLNLALGIALESQTGLRPTTRLEKQQKAGVLKAFRAAVRLMPSDPRFRYYLAEALRRAGRFTEAETTLQQVSKLDKIGLLKGVVAKSLAEIHSRSSVGF